MANTNEPLKTIYYSDEINDDFAGFVRKKKIIDENYNYLKRSVFWRVLAFIAYHIIMYPIAFFYLKIKFGLRYENRNIVKAYRKNGYFLYGNHTQAPGDAFIQALLSPQKKHVLVNADNIALKGTEHFMLMLGAMPLPTTVRGYRNFLSAVDTFCDKNESFTIYPEAHIWPYYTGIRNFPSASFSFPVRHKKAVFSFTTVYKKRRLRRTPRIIVKVVGPFFPDTSLPAKVAETKLRDEVYDAMVRAAAESDCEYIRYIYKPDEKLNQSEKLG